MKCQRIFKFAILVFAGVALAALLGLALGLLVMFLWNALMPAIFGLPHIGYWQAVGLFVLAHILFKGGNHNHPHENNHNSDRQCHGQSFRNKIKAWLNESEKTAEE